MWLFRRAGRYALYDVAWDTRELVLGLHRKVDELMATEQDLQTDLDAIKALVQKQADAIAALTAEVTAGTNVPPTAVSQAQLDALDAEAKAILSTTPTAPTTP